MDQINQQALCLSIKIQIGMSFRFDIHNSSHGALATLIYFCSVKSAKSASVMYIYIQCTGYIGIYFGAHGYIILEVLILKTTYSLRQFLPIFNSLFKHVTSQNIKSQFCNFS